MEGHGRSFQSLSSGLWILDFDLGNGSETWIWDLDKGPGSGTGLGLDNFKMVTGSDIHYLYLFHPELIFTLSVLARLLSVFGLVWLMHQALCCWFRIPLLSNVNIVADGLKCGGKRKICIPYMFGS